MTRIEREKTTVKQMVEIYCHGKKHACKGLCEECSALLYYAYLRLDHCKFGEKKPTCKKCPIHCYKPNMKEHMREAMRYAGPRIMLYHPIAAIKHLIRELPKQREQSEARFNYAESRQKKAEDQLKSHQNSKC